VQGSNLEPLMSALGQKRILERVRIMSVRLLEMFSDRNRVLGHLSFLMQLAAPHQAPGDISCLQRRAFGR